jgi:outer membrane protein OmpA-like peptidoglycan-associated protein
MFRTIISFIAVVAVAVPALSTALAQSASASTVTYSATQSFTPPSSNFTGASGGGDGWATATYDGRVFNVFHHQTYLGLMCHNESDASACWNGTDTGGSNLYKTITATVSGSSASFGTPAKPGLYLDQATGYLYVYAVDTTNHQPGVVCINLNSADTVTDPACSGSGGQPPAFTPLAAAGQTAWPASSNYSGTVTPTFYNGELFAWNPASGQVAAPGGGGATGVGKNSLLCYDVATQAPCANEPYSVTVSANTQATNSDPIPSPATTLVGSDMFIPTTWSTGGVVACVDLSLSTPGNCAGSWPQTMTNGAATFVIPSLDATGTATGVCGLNSSSVWSCWGFDGSVKATPSGLTSSTLTGWNWGGSPVVVGTRVFQVINSPSRVFCYDFSTNATCNGSSSGNFPLSLSNVTSPYTVNADPQRPTCIWINADSGTDQIQNFDANTGGSCANAPMRIYASSFVEPYQSCTPTSFNSITLTSGNFVTSPAPTLSFTNGNGVVIDGPYSFSSAASPSIDLTSLTYPTPIDLSTQSALPQFVLDLTPGTGGLGSVAVQVTWSGSQLAQCTPGYSGPAPSTAAASSVQDTSAQFNGSVDNSSSDTFGPVQFCYQTTSFTSGDCTGTTVNAGAGSVSATVTPYSSILTNLSRATTYYYELVATDATTNSPLYGGVESFSTGPVAATGPVSSLSDTGATLNGSLYNPGGDTLSPVQFCYQTTSFASGTCSATPVTATAGSTSPAGTQYSLQVTGLTSGHIYYYELVATDTSTPGTVLGGVRQFIAAPVTATSAATSVGDHSATFNGTVYNPSSDVLSSSFCYSTSSFTSGNCASATGSVTVSGNAGTAVASTTPFSKALSSLSPGVTYYFELVVTDTSTSLTYYGGVRTATTGPIVTTLNALNVRPSTATLVGSIYNPASDTFSSVKFCYQTTVFTSGNCSATPVTALAGTALSSTTDYTLALASLIPGSTYYFEIVGVDATNSSQTYDGGVQQFVAGPLVTTVGPSSVGVSTATLAGNVNNPNSMLIGASKFCYQSTSFVSGACTGTTVSAVLGTVTGLSSSYSASVTGLSAASRYYYELIVTASSSTTSYYGGVESFLTAQGPSLPSLPISLTVTQSGGTASANWTTPTSDGGAPIQGYVCSLMDGSTVIATTQTTSTSCSFASVGAPGTYSISVLAFNVVGQGPVANAMALTSTSTGNGTGPVTSPGAGKGSGKGSGKGKGAGKGNGKGKGHGKSTGKSKGKGKGTSKSTGKSTPKSTGKSTGYHGSTFLVAHWPSAAMIGLGGSPRYVAVLTPGSRSCVTQQTSCRFDGLNPSIHYTYRVTAAIEIVPFAENSFALVGAPLQQSNALVRLIVRFHPAVVKLAGYTDAYGSFRYNAFLSGERSHSVGTYVTAALKNMKIPLPKIFYLAFGESHPVVPNSSIAIAAGNRRVEVTFYLP